MFYDRKEAALQLAKALEKYRNKDVVALGIPRGGAVMGYHVALYLQAEFSLLVARKLGHPLNPEFAIGAVAEDGSVYLTPSAYDEVSSGQISAAIAVEKKEIERRIHILRNDEPLPMLKNRVVILVDDGIATGATIMAAIKMCRNKEAAKIVVAAPVSGTDLVAQLQKEVDAIIILKILEPFHSVSQVYLTFPQIEDKEAIAFMENWKLVSNSYRKPPASPQVIDEP